MTKMRYAFGAPQRDQRSVEIDNSLLALQSRWEAFHAGRGIDTLQSLVNDTQYLEGLIGCRPLTLVNKFRGK